MSLALILSSHVAGSRVGGSAQAAALVLCGVEAMVVPSALYGRHPGWGAPGGAATPVEIFQGMLDGIEANGLFGQVDLVITGYFAGAEQVRIAGRAIDAIRAAPRDGGRLPVVVVDPTMGDDGKGLYVAAAVAEAIARDLVPRADVVACNAWELGHLTGAEASDPEAAVRAARRLGKAVLVSSVYRTGEIGAVFADRDAAWLALHPKAATAPNGVGDLLTALYAAAMLEGQAPAYALARAVGGVAETVAAAGLWNLPELPVAAMGARLKQTSPTVRVERLG